MYRLETLLLAKASALGNLDAVWRHAHQSSAQWAYRRFEDTGNEAYLVSAAAQDLIGAGYAGDEVDAIFVVADTVEVLP